MPTDLQTQELERLKYITKSSFETINTHFVRINNYQKLLGEMNQQIKNLSYILNTFFIQQQERMKQSPIFQLHQLNSGDMIDHQKIKEQVVNMIKIGQLQDHNNIPLTSFLEQFDNMSAQILFLVDSLTTLTFQKEEVSIPSFKKEAESMRKIRVFQEYIQEDDSNRYQHIEGTYQIHQRPEQNQFQTQEKHKQLEDRLAKNKQRQRAENLIRIDQILEENSDQSIGENTRKLRCFQMKKEYFKIEVL